MMNKQIEATVILGRIHNAGWKVADGSKYPYLYTKADENLLISQEANETYGDGGIDNMVGVLSQLLEQSIRTNDSRDSKRLTKLSRGIMKVLGISSSRRSQIWDNACPALIESINAHQVFLSKVEEAYNNIIREPEHIPLIKNHGGNMVEAGWQISLKLHNHIHRQAKQYLRYDRYDRDSE